MHLFIYSVIIKVVSKLHFGMRVLKILLGT